MGCGASTRVHADGETIVVRNGRSVTVNGQKVKASRGQNVQLRLVAFADGKEIDQQFVCPPTSKFEVRVQGGVGGISTMSGDVIVDGSVSGAVTTMSGNVTVTGDAFGGVSTMSGPVNTSRA